VAYAFVQQREAENIATGVTTVDSGAFTSLTAGNLLVAHVWYTGVVEGPFTVTLSGAGSPTWVQESVVSAGANHLHSFYALNIGGGTTAQLTATMSTACDYPAIYVAEYSGFKTSGARLAFAGQNQATPGTSSNAVTSGLLGVLSEQPAGIIAYTFNENTDATPSAGTGFTALTAVNDYGGGTAGARPEHMRVTATTSVAGTFTTTAGTSPHKTAAWAFSEASGAGDVALAGSASTGGLGTASPGTSVEL
jgi:hypothetical protein